MESKGTRLVLLHWSQHTQFILTSWDYVEWFISAVELIQGSKLVLPGVCLSNDAFSCFHQKYLLLQTCRVNKPGIFEDFFCNCYCTPYRHCNHHSPAVQKKIYI